MRRISIGAQGFEDLRKNDAFYVDKTQFIQEWWDSLDAVTLITRPRRFGKTLNLDMVNCFFSNQYENRADLFEGLEIWKDEKYRKLQGTFPVIFLSFSMIKDATFQDARNSLVGVLTDLFQQYKDLWENDTREQKRRYEFMDITSQSSDTDITRSLSRLSQYLLYRYGKKPLILLDEYDTPLQEAYLNGYWDQMIGLIKRLFNATFKSNPAMERGLLTGITRVSKESIFSDLNNLAVISTTTNQYETAFGFTEQEVWSALREFGLYEERNTVKEWYDGFTFGSRSDIYNPWSITNYLKRQKFEPYWVNSSGNGLVNQLIQRGSAQVKMATEALLRGDSIETHIDEEIVFNRLGSGPEAIWSLLLAAGYLRLVSVKKSADYRTLPLYTLKLTNGEVHRMFVSMISEWFSPAENAPHEFVKAMISGDAAAMGTWMNKISRATFSSFDTGRKNSAEKPPERFYHGFVPGLLVREEQNYRLRSNRESGDGRYDICMFPLKPELPGIIIEFKVQDRKAGEKTLETTARNALKQIRSRGYATDLQDAGVRTIYAYGFAFSGKRVVIRKEG